LTADHVSSRIVRSTPLPLAVRISVLEITEILEMTTVLLLTHLFLFPKPEDCLHLADTATSIMTTSRLPSPTIMATMITDPCLSVFVSANTLDLATAVDAAENLVLLELVLFEAARILHLLAAPLAAAEVLQ